MKSLFAVLAATLFAATTHAAEPADPARFASCLSELKGGAAGRGVSGPSYERLTASLAPDLKVLDFLDYQPEFRTPIWDYLSGLVDEERVADGKALHKQWAEVLAAASARYKVDPATVVAVWGVESNFGRNFGQRPLLTSLSTLSCYGRRQAYFRGEFYDALKIVDSGDVKAEQLVGSWAGAFGHTQFMPSTFLRLAVDFDGDGRRDLVGSIPDALASTANFLHKAGWREGETWGYEVQLPAGFDASLAGRRNKQAVASWSARGVKRIDGSPLPASEAPAGVLLPAGPRGPAFLVFRNFDAIYGYNAAESYALAIAHLSDRLKGGQPFVTPWPTDDLGLSRAERRELQTLLIARGHAIGTVDGMLGDASRAAIRVEQQRLGHTVDGRAGQKLLTALRKS
ncbi:lytic murein transglycosylase [Zoogloea oleivorans]|uniref:Lytic murein transglycosylase n=2 Tax=Zoogloea TaxID=349 RepID=A0A6C2CLL1_9RHOO|nr:lytic murein transglycosylase [Zoogloea oleivorans]TYC55260.1 lytic murein transglycosylase [Zoogloea oleivorans]